METLTLNHKDYLAKLSLNQLTAIAKRTGMSGYSKQKKSELVDSLHQWMSTPNVIDSAMCCLSVYGLELLRKLCQHQHIPFDKSHITVFSDLFAYCYLSVEETENPEQLDTILMPEFSAQIMQWLEVNGDHYRQERLVLDCSFLCTKLWGVAPYSEILSALSSRWNCSLTHAELIQTLKNRIEEDNALLIFRENYLVLREIEEAQCIEVIVAAQKGKPFFFPTPEDALPYFELPHWQLNPIAPQYLTFLVDTLKIEETKASSTLEYIALSLQFQGTIPPLSEILERLEVVVTDSTLQSQHQALLQEYSKYIRLWINNGANTLELSAVSPTQPYIRHITKIGRNEPCPCGSQKKYKKCCGR